MSTNEPEPLPNVFAVILNWNGGEMVCAAVASVLAVDPPIPHVIVVDNASTDGSDGEVERGFPRVTLLRNAANLGFAAGNNVGIRYALEQGADCVLVLNNDTLLDRPAVGVMVAALLEDPRRGLVVPKIHSHTPSQDRRIWAAGARWRTFPPRVKMRGYGERDVGQYDTPGPVEYATGCALLVRRETFTAAGLLDKSYFMYQEDYAFCDRVRAGGLLLWYEPRAVVVHHVSASTGEGSPQKWRYWSQSMVLFYAQHYGYRPRAAVALGLFLVWVAAREIIKGKVGWLRPLCQGVGAGRRDLRQVKGSKG